MQFKFNQWASSASQASMRMHVYAVLIMAVLVYLYFHFPKSARDRQSRCHHSYLLDEKTEAQRV